MPSREARILIILEHSPGMTVQAIEGSLIGGYSFEWLGRLCESRRKVRSALARLERSRRVMYQTRSGKIPKERVYFAVGKIPHEGHDDH